MGVNQSKILVTMGAGLTTGLFWYFLYGSQHAKLRRRAQIKPVMGLRNSGSTCFLNSVLQALAACNFFTDWLAHKDDANRADFPPRVPKSYKGFQYPVIAALYRGLLVINRDIEDEDDVLMDKVPADIVISFRQQGFNFRTTEEQDTHEFYQFLAGVLYFEIENSIRRQQIGTIDCIVDEEDTSEVSGELISYSEVESARTDLPMPLPSAVIGAPVFLDEHTNSDGWSMVHDSAMSTHRIFSTRKVIVDTSSRASPQAPFRGMTWCTLQCLVCLHRTVPRLESFDSLTLMLPTAKMGESYVLWTLLCNFFKPAIVTQVDCDGCSKMAKCPTKSAFSKKTFLTRLPNTLIIHISRTCWSGTVSKRLEYVRFPEILNLSSLERHYDELVKVMTGLRQGLGLEEVENHELSLIRYRNSQYRLVAVVSHVGDPECGHFLTYRRGPSASRFRGSDLWFCVSDDMVVAVSLAEVLSTRAYMIFYEKITIQEWHGV